MKNGLLQRSAWPQPFHYPCCRSPCLCAHLQMHVFFFFLSLSFFHRSLLTGSWRETLGLWKSQRALCMCVCVFVCYVTLIMDLCTETVHLLAASLHSSLLMLCFPLGLCSKSMFTFFVLSLNEQFPSLMPHCYFCECKSLKTMRHTGIIFPCGFRTIVLQPLFNNLSD